MDRRALFRALTLGALCVVFGSGCGDGSGLNNHAGLDGGEAATDSTVQPDIEHDVALEAEKDAGNERDVEVACPEGYQDNDHDGSCLADCKTSGLACAGHARCDDSQGVVTCVCEDGYQDNDHDGSCLATCDTALLDCGSGSRCHDEDGEALCQCDDGLQDNDGDGECLPTCAASGEACGGHGTCHDDTGAVGCTCDAGYAGDGCGVCAVGFQDNDGDGTCFWNCDLSNLDCPAHGHCEDSSGEALCACDAAYDGIDCRACAAGYQDRDHDGECLPDCATAQDPCNGPGTCDDMSGEATCACDPGHQDFDGDGTCKPDCSTASLICPFGQSCTIWAGEATCVCPLGYDGQDCMSCATGFEDDGGMCKPDHVWTVLAYMNADNDLETAAIADLEEMMQVGSGSGVHVVVLLDTFVGGGHVLYVEPGQSVTVANLGEPDLGDWRTLRDFGVWAVHRYPAERYALILWDHGHGWSDRHGRWVGPLQRGFSEDVHGGAGRISISGGELDRALEGIKTAAGSNIDVLGFDACLMGMWEVARTAAPHANLLVASEENEPADGWPYEVVLGALVSDPAMSATTFAENVVDAYHDASPMHFTLSATDLVVVADLDDTIASLVEALVAHPALFDEVDGVRLETQGFGDSDFRDLRDLVERILAIPNLPADVLGAAGALSTGLEGAILHHRALSTHPNARGLSIYLPPKGGGMDCAYLDVDAAWSASGWGSLLVPFTEAGCGPWP